MYGEMMIGETTSFNEDASTALRAQESLQRHLEELEDWDEEARRKVIEILDCVDDLHRVALKRVEAVLGDHDVDRLRRDPVSNWLMDAYEIGVDAEEQARSALEKVRPYVESHGGSIDVLGVRDGVVSVRMAGACRGCTGSADTLRLGAEAALKESMPGFAGLEVEPDDAPAHPPPDPVLLQVEARPPGAQAAAVGGRAAGAAG